MILNSTWLAVALPAVLPIVLASSGLAATLVENGHPKAVIVVPAGRESPEATDLQVYLQKVSGARLPIVPENKLGELPNVASRLFVGPCQAAARVIDLKKLQPEGFVIKTDGGDLFIVGRDMTEKGLEVEGKRVPLTASFGVACCAETDGTTTENLIRLADKALYRSKAEGRNRISVAHLRAAGAPKAVG